MSEYRPTFVNYEPNPVAHRLHIHFEDGAVDIKDKGSAAKAEYADSRQDEVILTFPWTAPVPPCRRFEPEVQPDGTVGALARPEAASCVMPTFAHGSPRFPGIDEWWWSRYVAEGPPPNHVLVDHPFPEGRHHGDPDTPFQIQPDRPTST